MRCVCVLGGGKGEGGRNVAQVEKVEDPSDMKGFIFIGGLNCPMNCIDSLIIELSILASLCKRKHLFGYLSKPCRCLYHLADINNSTTSKSSHFIEKLKTYITIKVLLPCGFPTFFNFFNLFKFLIFPLYFVHLFSCMLMKMLHLVFIPY